MRKKLTQPSAIRWYPVALGFHVAAWRFRLAYPLACVRQHVLRVELLASIVLLCAMRPLVSAPQSCTLVALKDSPPRCGLPRDGPHGPWHPGQIFWAWSRFPHLLRRNKTWDTSQLGASRWTLNRRFAPFWLIDIPNTPDPNRIYDQIFIDGTYTAAGCLLIAASHDHVIAWHWAKSETAKAYKKLLSKIPPPLCVVLDGGQGAYSAIKTCWPNTRIQRCLVHAQRVVRRYTTSRPRTDAGKAIYGLALALTKVTTVDQAREWVVQLHDFGQVHKRFLNEKTTVPKQRQTTKHQWEWTHLRVRRAYNSLLDLSHKGWLFTYLQPPTAAITPNNWV